MLSILTCKKRAEQYQGFAKYNELIHRYDSNNTSGIDNTGLPPRRAQSMTNGADQAAVAALRLHYKQKEQAQPPVRPKGRTSSLTSNSGQLRQYVYNPKPSYQTGNAQRQQSQPRYNSLSSALRHEENSRIPEDGEEIVVTKTTKVVDSQGRTRSITTHKVRTLSDGSNIIETTTKNISRGNSRTNSRTNSLTSLGNDRANSLTHVNLDKIDEDLQDFDYNYELDGMNGERSKGTDLKLNVQQPKTSPSNQESPNTSQPASPKKVIKTVEETTQQNTQQNSIQIKPLRSILKSPNSISDEEFKDALESLEEQQQKLDHPYKNFASSAVDSNLVNEFIQPQPPVSPQKRANLTRRYSDDVQDKHTRTNVALPRRFNDDVHSQVLTNSTIQFDERVETIRIPAYKAKPTKPASSEIGPEFYAAAMQAAYKNVYGDRAIPQEVLGDTKPIKAPAVVPKTEPQEPKVAYGSHHREFATHSMRDGKDAKQRKDKAKEEKKLIDDERKLLEEERKLQLELEKLAAKEAAREAKVRAKLDKLQGKIDKKEKKRFGLFRRKELVGSDNTSIGFLGLGTSVGDTSSATGTNGTNGTHGVESIFSDGTTQSPDPLTPPMTNTANFVTPEKINERDEDTKPDSPITLKSDFETPVTTSEFTSPAKTALAPPVNSVSPIKKELDSPKVVNSALDSPGVIKNDLDSRILQKGPETPKIIHTTLKSELDSPQVVSPEYNAKAEPVTKSDPVSAEVKPDVSKPVTVDVEPVSNSVSASGEEKPEAPNTVPTEVKHEALGSTPDYLKGANGITPVTPVAASVRASPTTPDEVAVSSFKPPAVKTLDESLVQDTTHSEETAGVPAPVRIAAPPVAVPEIAPPAVDFQQVAPDTPPPAFVPNATTETLSTAPIIAPIIAPILAPVNGQPVLVALDSTPLDASSENTLKPDAEVTKAPLAADEKQSIRVLPEPTKGVQKLLLEELPEPTKDISPSVHPAPPVSELHHSATHPPLSPIVVETQLADREHPPKAELPSPTVLPVSSYSAHNQESLYVVHTPQQHKIVEELPLPTVSSEYPIAERSDIVQELLPVPGSPTEDKSHRIILPYLDRSKETTPSPMQGAEVDPLPESLYIEQESEVSPKKKKKVSRFKQRVYKLFINNYQG